jgi:hypothetical protein
MTSTIYCDRTSCSSLKNRRFGGTYRLHLRGSKANRSPLATCFHAGIFLSLFDLENWSGNFLRNVGSLPTDYTALYPKRYSFPDWLCRCHTFLLRLVRELVWPRNLSVRFRNLLLNAVLRAARQYYIMPSVTLIPSATHTPTTAANLASEQPFGEHPSVGSALANGFKCRVLETLLSRSG